MCVKARLKGRHNGVLYLSTVSLVSYYVTDFGDIHAYLLVSFQESTHILKANRHACLHQELEQVYI